MRKLRIAIDNGHGYNTNGKRTPPMPNNNKVIREWEFNHPTAKELERIFLSQGHSVLMVSDTSVDTPLLTRTRRANDWNADVFISIHYNAYKGIWGDHGGIETLYYYGSKEGRELATIVQNNLIKETGLRDRKAKPRSDLHVLNGTKMLAILTECGFMDNLYEAELMLDTNHQKKCAVAIANGVNLYFKTGIDMITEDEGKDERIEIEMSFNSDVVKAKGYKRHNVNYIPIRTLEQMGYIVDWNAETGMVELRDSDFIKSIKNVAIEEYLKHGILPSLTIAQAILESNWGKSQNGNNLFGIKADSRWTGKTNTKETKEYINGEWIVVVAKFRAYSNFTESIRDRSNFLLAPRYNKVLQTKDYKVACSEIYKAGYATDPNYPQKLIGIIEGNRLYDIDKEAFAEEGMIEIKMNYNGSPLSTKGYKENDMNYVPIRLLERLGCRVDWDGSTKTIIINK